MASPANFSFLPQSSPSFLPSAQYHLASYPLTNGKVAVLLPTVNPFLVDSSTATAASQPSLIPVFSKEPKHGMSPPEMMPLGLDTRPVFWKSIPWLRKLAKLVFVLYEKCVKFFYFNYIVILKGLISMVWLRFNLT